MEGNIRIIETENGLGEDEVSVSRWQKYGKDRLYVNQLSWSHDSCYVDLDGGEGHALWAGASAEVDENTVVIESTKSKGGSTDERYRAVLEVQ